MKTKFAVLLLMVGVIGLFLVGCGCLGCLVEPQKVVLAFEDIHFDYNSSAITPAAQTILNNDIKILKENPKARVRIGGYASASGTDAYNHQLSEKRATAIKKYLTKEGHISSDRFSTIGYGETRPAMSEANPKDIESDAAKANRRVHFEIVAQ
jgi:outer membrane protein OmpA-like peptidoglycan-associated protein